MPTTAHAHCAPYWEQEVSLLLKLLYHFHELLVLYTQRLLLLRAYSPTAALPNAGSGGRST